MRLLVLSDSHGDIYSLKSAIIQQPSADYIFFLGDGRTDIEDVKLMFPDKQFICVRGNCDFSSPYPAYALERLSGKTVFATHGHNENVKYGDTNLIYSALEKKADIVLYGHTHVQLSRYEDGLYILNPGSIREGKYGVVDILDKGILCSEMKVMY